MTRRHLLTLIRTELRNELRVGEVTMVALPFAVVALLVIPLAVGIDTPLLERIGPGIYWTILLVFGVIVTQRHSASGSAATRDLMRLAGVDPAVRFAATATSTFLLLLGFAVGAGVATLLLYDPNLGDWGWLALVIPLAAAGLAMTGTIAHTVTTGVTIRASLAPLIVIPLSVPVLLGAAQATEGLRQGAGILRWLLLLAIVDVILAIAGVVTARPLEEAAS